MQVRLIESWCVSPFTLAKLCITLELFKTESPSSIIKAASGKSGGSKRSPKNIVHANGKRKQCKLKIIVI